MICSGRDKIESATDLAKAVDTAQKLNLDALVVVGGDDSNTNAAVLAEHFLSKGAVHFHALSHMAFLTMSSQACLAKWNRSIPYLPTDLTGCILQTNRSQVGLLIDVELTTWPSS